MGGRHWFHGMTVQFIAAVVSIAMAMAAFVTVIAHDEQPAAPDHTVTVVVEPGDTLWAIAQRHATPSVGTAENVRAIRALNGLRDARIHPGQVLLVPCDARAGGALAASGDPAGVRGSRTP